MVTSRCTNQKSQGSGPEYYVPRHIVQLVDCSAHLTAFCESGSLTEHTVKLIIFQVNWGRKWSFLVRALESVKSFDIHHSLWF